MAETILYTVPNCSSCDRARAGLANEGIEFEERNVMLNRAWFDEVLRYSVSVPVILRGDKVQVGWGRSLGCLIT